MAAAAATAVSAATKATVEETMAATDATTIAARKDTVADTRRTVTVEAVKKEDTAVTMADTAKKDVTMAVVEGSAERRDAMRAAVAMATAQVEAVTEEEVDTVTIGVRRAAMAEDVRKDTVEAEAMATTAPAAATVAMARMSVAMREAATVEVAKTTHIVAVPAVDRATATTIDPQADTTVGATAAMAKAHREAMMVALEITAASTPLALHTAAAVVTAAAQMSSARLLTMLSKTMARQKTRTSSALPLACFPATNRSFRTRTLTKTMQFSSTRSSTVTNREATTRQLRTMLALQQLCKL